MASWQTGWFSWTSAKHPFGIRFLYSLEDLPKICASRRKYRLYNYLSVKNREVSWKRKQIILEFPLDFIKEICSYHFRGHHWTEITCVVNGFSQYPRKYGDSVPHHARHSSMSRNWWQGNTRISTSIVLFRNSSMIYWAPQLYSLFIGMGVRNANDI